MLSEFGAFVALIWGPGLLVLALFRPEPKEKRGRIATAVFSWSSLVTAGCLLAVELGAAHDHAAPVHWAYVVGVCLALASAMLLLVTRRGPFSRSLTAAPAHGVPGAWAIVRAGLLLLVADTIIVMSTGLAQPGFALAGVLLGVGLITWAALALRASRARKAA